MTIGRGSIVTRIVGTVSICIISAMSVVLLVTVLITKDTMEELHRFINDSHATHIERIIDTMVSDVVSAQLTGNKQVVELQKGNLIEEIRRYWASSGIEGMVLEGRRAIVSTVDEDTSRRILALDEGLDRFQYYRGLSHVSGTSRKIALWGWRIVTVQKPVSLLSNRYGLVFLSPLVIIATLAVLGMVAWILRRNLIAPVGTIIGSLKSGCRVPVVGIDEIDRIAAAINDTMSMAETRTGQLRLLHDIAMSLKSEAPSYGMLEQILMCAARHLEVRRGFVALYGADGTPVRIVSCGEGVDALLTQWRDRVLATMHGLGGPLLCNSADALHDAGIDGDLAGNVLVLPIRSSGDGIDAVLCLADKRTPFDTADLDLVQAIGADILVGLRAIGHEESLARFKQVIDSAFDGIVLMDHAGRITYVNDAFEKMLGFSAADAKGNDLSIIKSGCMDESFYRSLWARLRCGEVWRGDLLNTRKDGETCHTSTVLFPVNGDDGTPLYFAAILRDVTEEKRLYEQLLRAQKMEIVGTIAGTVAHDFNNILSAIQGYGELIAARMSGDEQVRKAAGVICDAARKGTGIAGRMLAAIRQERTERAELDLNGTIRSTLELLDHSIPRNISVMLDLSAHLPPVTGQVSQMQQVVMNLVVNARDAMQAGGRITIRTAVTEEEPACPGTWVRLTVEDTGAGMPPDIRDKVFDPFFTTKEDGAGTGLGLYIVRSIIKAQGGHLSVGSEPGVGTRFDILLPTAGSAPMPAVELEKVERGSGIILVVDDEKDIRELCKDVLESLGYEVLTASSGGECLRVYTEHLGRVALVILDMVMPAMGGGEVFAALRMLDPKARVLLMSGFGLRSLPGIADLLKAGALDFVEKPFTMVRLTQIIKRHLASP